MIRTLNEKVPAVVRNIRSSHVWRPRDMMNWHRMVKPLRAMTSEDSDFDVFQLVFSMCTSLSIDYEPHIIEERRFLTPSYNPLGSSAPHRTEPIVAMFCDSPDHTSGVATTISQWKSEAARIGCDLHIYSSGFNSVIPEAVCFPPMGTLKLSAYNGLHLHVPRINEVLQYMQQTTIDVVHISTPGPMGLLGLLVAEMLNVPICGTYHTDFPRYAATLTGDPQVTQTTWDYMKWFYGRMDIVNAPSHSTCNELISQGFDSARVKVVGRGIDTAAFSPAHRNESLRAEWGLQYANKLLYVGRVSEEKNLSVLSEAFKRIARRRNDTCLVIVGDGPYLSEMQSDLAGLPVIFTGVKKGKELSEIYASCDLFVFPSETDTFGVVLIEAQASGVPVIASSRGGPKDCILNGITGSVLDRMDPDTLSRAINNLLDEPDHLHSMGRMAYRHARTMTPEASFRAFWNCHRLCLQTDMESHEPGDFRMSA